MGRKARSCTAGIALLEALVSMSIIAFGVSAPLVAFRTAARTQARLEETHVGRDLAERQCMAVRLGTAGAGNGFFEPPFEKYAWRIHIISAEEDVPFQFLRINVSRQVQDRATDIYTLETLVPVASQ